MSRARLIFIVLYITSILLLTVHLRTSSSRLFYLYRAAHVQQNRLKQNLWRNQLRLEELINPERIEAVTQEQDENDR